jgi:N-acetylmuramoyl-L-alanine amidase
MEFKQTPNYTKGTGISKIGFVLHGTLGSYQSSINWLETSPEQRQDHTYSSAHYIIGRNDGEVIQLVKDEDIAWHAGYISNPTPRAAKVLPKKTDGSFDNPNKYFIGIEFVWGYDMNSDGTITPSERTLTEWQYSCVMDIIKASGIAYNPDYVLSHKEIASYKGDDMLFACIELQKRFLNTDMVIPVAEQIEVIKKKISILTKMLQLIKLVK